MIMTDEYTIIDGQMYVTAVQIEQVYGIRYWALKYRERVKDIQAHRFAGRGNVDYYLKSDVEKLKAKVSTGKLTKRKLPKNNSK